MPTGKGAIFILKNNAGTFTPVYQQADPGSGIGGYDLSSAYDRASSLGYPPKFLLHGQVRVYCLSNLEHCERFMR